MKSNSRSIMLLLTVIVVGLGAGVWMYRADLCQWAKDRNLLPGGGGAETLVGTPASSTPNGTTRIEVNASGFTPDAVTVSPGEGQVLEFVRTADKTCATAVVFAKTGQRFDLPLNTPVRVPISLKPGETMSFACPMDMYRGTVTVSETSEPTESVTKIEIGAEGFSPESVVIAPGDNRILEFIRKVDNTCISAVVFPSTGGRHELPVGTPVRVPISAKPGETISFTCPMDMYHGKVVVSDQAAMGVDYTHGDAHDPSEIAYWTCSMHPSVKSSTPGKCPICSMDLVSVTRREVETGVILVDAQRRQLIGVTTALVARRDLVDEIRTVGRVSVDESRLAEVTLRFEAWIGKVLADTTGKEVRKGEPMFTFYSPQLWSLQEEYLEALRRGQGEGSNSSELAKAAEMRLRLWEIDDAQIESLRQRGSAIEYLAMNAPTSGTVLEKHVVSGSAVEAGMPLYRIADLSTVWIEAEIYEQDIPRITKGQKANISLQGVPNGNFEGTVSYVYPYLNAETRTGRVRFEVPNPDGFLKLDMYADLRIELPLGERTTVPEGAVIHAGASHVVFVDLGEGRLEPRRVKVGARTDDYIEIVEGLNEGETVVTSANFLIAAESKLKSGIEKW